MDNKDKEILEKTISEFGSNYAKFPTKTREYLRKFGEHLIENLQK